VPIFLRIAHQHGYRQISRAANQYFLGHLKHYHGVPTASNNDEDDEQISRILSNSPLLNGDSSGTASAPASIHIIDDLEQETGVLGFRATAILSLEFCLLWFLANYFVAACLEYTSVASSTILTSTSSIWTLIFGALFRVERFTFNKLVGVLASLAGIILISLVDLTGDSDKNRGSFPHKSQQQIAIGRSCSLRSS
jgi:solute carrier family 35 protein F5